MHRETADRHLPPEAYAQDISGIARFGRNGTMVLGGLALLDEGLKVASELMHNQPILGELGKGVEIGAIALVGATALHLIHKKFENIAGTTGQQG